MPRHFYIANAEILTNNFENKIVVYIFKKAKFFDRNILSEYHKRLKQFKNKYLFFKYLSTIISYQYENFEFKNFSCSITSMLFIFEHSIAFKQNRQIYFPINLHCK